MFVCHLELPYCQLSAKISSAYAFSKKLGYKLLIDDETGIIHDLGKAKKRSRANWKPKYELDIFNLSSEVAEKKYKFLEKGAHTKRKFLKFIDSFSSKKNFY